jgi:hypothetical protein
MSNVKMPQDRYGSNATEMGCPSYVRFPPESDPGALRFTPDDRTSSEPIGMSQRCQFRKSRLLFDHFIGAREQRWRNIQTERPGGPEIDQQFEYNWPFNWYV